MKFLSAALLVLSCAVAEAQSAKPRELTIQEAHSILEAYIPDATKHLPGYELEDFSGYDPERFYFIEVVWNNPGGSVVWGNYMVDKETGDLWSAVVCDKYSSRRIRDVQQQVRKKIGLTDAEYKRIKRPGPMCE